MAVKTWLQTHTTEQAAQRIHEIAAPGLRIALFRTGEVHREQYAGVPRWILTRHRARRMEAPICDFAEGYPSKTRALRAMLELAEEELQSLLAPQPPA